jgi:hypothetical protein
VTDRTFAVASDDALVGMIRGATKRLVVIAPALTKAVAEAISKRFPDLGKLDATVILDSDPEVYRLGFGDVDALDAFRQASADAMFPLHEQPGVRIGVVISDDTTMVYSPVSQNIEAGSTSVEKPNAIVLKGQSSDHIASAAGTDRSEKARAPEVGGKALEPKKVEQMQEDLKKNPPKPFDIARKMNVFTSKVQYVEFSASNYKLTTRQVPLPQELVDVADDELKSRISSRIRSPLDGIGKVDVVVEQDGKSQPLEIDDDWLNQERRRIEDFTFPIPNFGRVILYQHRDQFDTATARFKLIVEKDQAALQAALATKRSEFEKRIIDEFSPRWTQKPPDYFARYDLEPTPEIIERELRRLAQELFESAIDFKAPDVKILYKNVAPENILDKRFLDPLKAIMLRRRVPQTIIDTLFESGQAAPVAGAFLGR